MSDPFGAAIEAAVSRAIAAQFKIIDEKLDARIEFKMKALKKPAEMPPAPEHGERLVSTAEAGKVLGVHRTTLLRYEENGLIPKRIALPTGRTGFKLSELRAFIDALPEASGEVVVSNPSKVRKAKAS